MKSTNTEARKIRQETEGPYTITIVEQTTTTLDGRQVLEVARYCDIETETSRIRSFRLGSGVHPDDLMNNIVNDIANDDFEPFRY